MQRILTSTLGAELKPTDRSSLTMQICLTGGCLTGGCLPSRPSGRGLNTSKPVRKPPCLIIASRKFRSFNTGHELNSHGFA